MTQKVSFKQALTAGAMASGAAIVLNVVLFYILRAAGIFTDDVFIQPGQTLTVGPVIMSSIMPTFVATLVFFLLEKYTANGFRIFTIIGVIIFILFLVPPFTSLPQAPVGFSLGLEAMHVVVYGTLMYFLNKAVQAAKS